MEQLIEVHKALGAGLLESNYEKAMLFELELRGLSCKAQQTVYVDYKGKILDCELRYDILVEELIVVENKSVLKMHPTYSAQILSYMKHLKIPKGILFNFNVSNLYKEGVQTFVNEYFSNLPLE